MTKCCERDLTTPFCPFCGKANKDPMLALVEHLRRVAGVNRKQAKTWSANGSASSDKRAKTYISRAEQMEEWADEVLALVKLRIVQGKP